ncbi:23S rRNA (adenine(1618)-N(6))-methyltransferase RlmF [Sodalis praecaptivus]|uniref:23S rRNA (adenine(1618)-N(6))-methyltransferase RlmF n=1 Tax=Sodalis praecaptivus TaxID=1239307 RepID=UPI0027F04730|nr:23S rRNA (adenine(1618)-N(6))-methyltransferase RlmF [Sodalis praecaptivus]CAJ0998834.1 Ribosomal RNA large subunit methyltransferase F [Sodalis praecaptivus]
MKKSVPPTAEKTSLHPRNRHRGRYDFAALVAACPPLAPFVRPTPGGTPSVDFASPAAVTLLNRALLLHHYGLRHWDIPTGFLCPPVPGRADYLHHLADLLAAGNGGSIPRGRRVMLLDIGVGANCIYPIIGHHEYGWRFTGSDIDPPSLRWARHLADMNPSLAGALRLRRQSQPAAIFDGIIGAAERFDATLCNPPFHASAREAEASTRRKQIQLARSTQRRRESTLGAGNRGGAAGDGFPVRQTDVAAANFGGRHNELWCPGGELAFVRRMVAESVTYARHCLWFTTLLSKSSSLAPLYRAIEQAGASAVRTVQMGQEQKISRFVAWSFYDAAGQAEWAARRWRD